MRHDDEKRKKQRIHSVSPLDFSVTVACVSCLSFYCRSLCLVTKELRLLLLEVFFFFFVAPFRHRIMLKTL
ncbi:uncharacterized protein BYT42DRAFT_576975, partial [Radiomyces spectabilis]|uniref:uncharacterized protein n=1 Tax=Radiomyces spectabilis TaxID=64574 RepID=UPI00221FBA77